MGEFCPFCWGRNVKPVGAHPRPGWPAANGRIWECEDCEKWYWADRREEAPALFMLCETTILHPQRCYPEIRDVRESETAGFLRRRQAEFNHLCSGCPHGRFLPEPKAVVPPQAYTAEAP
jgi:hypothetical protein